jgi:hypothetical protein
MPWSRSTSRSRSRAERSQGGTLSHGGISLQIQVERYTSQPARETIDIARTKSASGLTDTSSISSIPPGASGGGDDFAHGYRESKVGFDFTGEKATRHVFPTNSSGLNAVVGAPEHLVSYSHYPPSPPRSLVPQEQPEKTYPGCHPYSLV